MATVSKALVTNQTISAPLISPSVNLAGSATYWNAALDTTAHAGVLCSFTIQSSPDNITFSDVSNNSFTGGDGIDPRGNDESHQVQTFTLFGTGPWWRVNITQVTGSFLINTLVVSNFS